MVKLAQVTDNSFDAQVLKCDIPVLTCFLAEWPAPAKKMASALAELATEYEGRLKVVGLDIKANPIITSTWSILNVPTVVLFKFGQEVERITGVLSVEALMEKVAPYLDE